MLQRAVVRFDSSLNEAVVRPDYPLYNSAGSSILPLHDALGGQFDSGVSSQKTLEVLCTYGGFIIQFYENCVYL
jgi:hypothetical protein